MRSLSARNAFAANEREDASDEFLAVGEVSMPLAAAGGQREIEREQNE